MFSTPVGAACGCLHRRVAGLRERMRGPRRPQGVALISSTVIHHSAATDAAGARVLDTTFKGKHVFTAWGLRGPELSRSADPAATVAARRALHAVSGHSEGPRSPEVFIANQSAVAITVYRLLTEARSGDAIFFLCDSQAVVDWLVTALEVRDAD